jgi:hypothetical protein
MDVAVGIQHGRPLAKTLQFKSTTSESGPCKMGHCFRIFSNLNELYVSVPHNNKPAFCYHSLSADLKTFFFFKSLVIKK